MSRLNYAAALALALGAVGPVADYPIRGRRDHDGDIRFTHAPRRRSLHGSAKRKQRNRVRNRIARQSRKANRK